MPTGAGEYRPGDIVEASTIYNTVMQGPEARENLNINLDAVTPVATDVDVAGLAMRDWPTTSVSRYVDRLIAPSDPDFKQPFHELPPSHYPYREMYEDADSPMLWQMAKSQVEQEIIDDKMYAQMDVADWAGYMGMQMVDPISLALTVGTGSVFTMGRGVSVGQAAARTAALGAGEAAAIEAVLQLTDPLRTIDESVLSTVAGGAFGAFLGAGGQRVYNMWKGQSPEPVRAEINKLIRDEVELVRAENGFEMDGAVDTPLTPVQRQTDELPVDADETVQAVDDLAELDTQNPAVIGTDAKAETPKFSPFSPLVNNRLLQSAQTIMLYNKTSPAFSRFADMLSSRNIFKHGDYNGTAYNGKTLAQEIKKTERRMLKTAIDETTSVQRALRKDGIKLSVDEISERIGKAARRVGQASEENILIREAGERVRAQFEDWKQRGLKTKVLSKEAVQDMENYLPRLWDMEAVAKRPIVFRQKIRAYLSNKHPEMTEDEIVQATRDIKDSLHRVNNGESNALEFHVTRKDPKSGHAKARRLTMPDEEIEDFLASDIRILSDRYARGVGSDILVREIFGADNIVDVNGLPMPKAQYQAGLQQFDEAIEALENTGTKSALKKAEKLRKKRKLTAEAAESFLRQILRRPNTPQGQVRSVIDETSRQLRGYAGATQLGAVVESAFPDPANNILQHGMANVLFSLPEFFKTLPAVFSRTPVTGRRATQFREMDIALDNMLNTRMEALADVSEMSRYGMKRNFFHGSEVARKAFRVFLADRWNTGVKLFAATVAERAVMKDAAKMAAGKLGKHRTAKMNRIGMTPEMAKRISGNVKAHGKRRGLLNYDKWDKDTYEDLQRMLWRESEFQVVAPDAGEMPELFDSEVGKLFMQYKTFILSHTMKQMIPATQRLSAGDMTVLAGMTTMVGLGIFSQYVKDVTRSFDKDSGFEIDKVNDEWAKKTPMDLAAIGVKHSGVLSYLPTFMAGLDNFFNNELGEAVGMTPRKRAYSPGGLENEAAGIGYAYDVGASAKASAQAAAGVKDYTARDLNRLRRLIPMQNTFYLQWMFDMGEQTIADEFNLPEKSGQGGRTR